MAYAFGTDPNQATGSIVIDETGVVTNAKGNPIAYQAGITANSVDFRAVFSRRKNFVAAGLTYTVQFSADLDVWHNAVNEPILLDGSDADIDVVYVGFPFAVGNELDGFVKPQFMRVGVASAE